MNAGVITNTKTGESLDLDAVAKLPEETQKAIFKAHQFSPTTRIPCFGISTEPRGKCCPCGNDILEAGQCERNQNWKTYYRCNKCGREVQSYGRELTDKTSEELWEAWGKEYWDNESDDWKKEETK